MPDTSALVAFSVAALILFIVPGPAVLYIIGQSLAGGSRAGLVSVAGIHTGSLVHIAAAIAGLTTLLATSAVAFRTVKWAGAAYLLFLGIRSLVRRHDAESATPQTAPATSLRRVFRQGFIVNLLNPKTAVFFLAFVPQFVDATRGTTSQILVLGALFVVLGTVSDSLYATVVGSLGQRLTRANWWRTGRWAVPAVTYTGLGVFAALSGGDPEG
jgi:threonine/homoserine/homoserine lactone efflux protein